MASTKIHFVNPQTNHHREAPVGFAWTVLFFGFFPALFRKDWKWALIIFLLAGMTCYLSTIVFAFLYNRLYIRDLIADGYFARSITDGTIEQAAAKLEISIPTEQSRP